jgi:hypothetical protein
MRRSLPVLDDKAIPDALDLVEIPIPCEVPWDGMPGDERVRHCGQCKQNVYNVSAFTRTEAIKLLRSRACLRIYRRPDNTVITSDCRERLRAARKRGLLVFAGALLVVLWAQICAQFVGVIGLRRVLGGGRTMGVAAPMPGQIVGDAPAPPPPPRILMGEPAPAPQPLMGEVAPVPPRPPAVRKDRKPSEAGEPRLMGRVAPAPAHKMGKPALPDLD